MDFEIIKQFEELEEYIDQVIAAADQNKRSFGFLPRPAYQEQALQGRLWVCVDSEGQYCGHLLFGGKPLSLRILQLYVKGKNRKCGVGRRLLSELEAHGESHSCLSISARVAADLKANQFWERHGYKVCRQVDGGKTTGRRINIRVKSLDVPRLFDPSDFHDETQHADLTVETRATLSSATYALDINVIFDLVKDRENADIVCQLLGFSMYGNGQMCITSEFAVELEKGNSD